MATNVATAPPEQAQPPGREQPWCRDPDAAAREWFELTAAVSPFVVAVVDATEFRLVYANQAYAEALGEDLASLIGRSIVDTAPSEELAAVRSRMSDVLAGATPDSVFTRRYRRRDGSTFQGEAGVGALRDQSGRVRYLLVQARPVEETANLDAGETSRVLAFLKPLLRCGADLVAVLDAKGHTVWAGTSLRDWLGDDALTRNCDFAEAVHPDDGARLRGFLGGATTRATVSGPCRLRVGSPDTPHAIELFASPWPPDPGLVFALARRVDVPGDERVTRRQQELERSLREIVKTAADALGGPTDGFTGSLPPEAATLTPREREILLLLLRGHRVSTIASRLYLAPGTVRNHLSRTFQKLGVSSQSELLDRLHDAPPLPKP